MEVYVLFELAQYYDTSDAVLGVFSSPEKAMEVRKGNWRGGKANGDMTFWEMERQEYIRPGSQQYTQSYCIALYELDRVCGLEAFVVVEGEA